MTMIHTLVMALLVRVYAVVLLPPKFATRIELDNGGEKISLAVVPTTTKDWSLDPTTTSLFEVW
jgi:hypothetical protein